MPSMPSMPSMPLVSRLPAKRLAFSGLALAAAVALGGCSGGSSGGGSSPGGGDTVTATEQGGVQVAKVTGTAGIAFSPATIKVHTGKVRIEFSVPSDSAPHSFTVDALGADSGVFSGDTKPVTFTVSKPGTYQVTCTVHPSMKATLIVTA